MFSVRRVVSVVDRTWENIYPTFSSPLGSTLLLIEKATHDPLYLWDIMIIPLASIHNYKKVIKINLTTAINSEILHSLVQWFPNGGLGFYHSGNPTISSQIHNAFH
jgi:hypothetical protein